MLPPFSGSDRCLCECSYVLTNQFAYFPVNLSQPVNGMFDNEEERLRDESQECLSKTLKAFKRQVLLPIPVMT